ncbi:MAG: ABC transporter substrate-binding protein [Pseudolysinimonas sp.]
MSSQQRRTTRVPRALGLIAAAASITLLAVGCSSGGGGGGDANSPYGFKAAKQIKNSALTILVDADRTPIAKAFQADHPEIKVNIETYDGNSGGTNSFQTKISLADKAGSGWPDVVWSGQVNDASWAAVGKNGAQAFATPLDQGVISKKWLDGYTKGAEDPVTVGGHIYGVRDNLAPVVFWYNKTLFTQFGYTVPETWEDYQALGDKLAAEHPGYTLGSIGDSFTAVLTNMWSAQAPIYTVKGTTFKSDFSDSHSTKMIALMDHMLANHSLNTVGLFTPDFPKQDKGKLLGIPGPTWFTGALFNNPTSLAGVAGEWGAGTPLHWAGEPIGTGNVGGGFWYGSSHSTNLKAEAAFLQYAVAGPQSVKLITGLPAYASTASAWLDAQVSGGFWADSDKFKDVVNTAATNIWPGWGATLSFSSEPGWNTIVAPALAKGQTIASVVDAWQKQYENQAQVNGYTVK